MIDSIYRNRKKGERPSILNQEVLAGQNLTIRYDFYCLLRTLNICQKLIQIGLLFVLVSLFALKKTKQRVFLEYFIILVVEIGAYAFYLDYVPTPKGEENRLAQEASTLQMIMNNSGNEAPKEKAALVPPQQQAADSNPGKRESVVIRSLRKPAGTAEHHSLEQPELEEGEESLHLNGKNIPKMSLREGEDPIDSLIRTLSTDITYSINLKKT